MFPEARSLRPEDLHIGLTASFERNISEDDVRTFAANSGDFNPLHVNAEYAAETHYGRPLVHGALQTGLASALLGMHLPGRSALLLSIQGRFPAPLFVPSTVTVAGEVTTWNPGTHSGMVHVTVRCGEVVTSDFLLGFLLRTT